LKFLKNYKTNAPLITHTHNQLNLYRFSQFCEACPRVTLTPQFSLVQLGLDTLLDQGSQGF